MLSCSRYNEFLEVVVIILSSPGRVWEFQFLHTTSGQSSLTLAIARIFHFDNSAVYLFVLSPDYNLVFLIWKFLLAMTLRILFQGMLAIWIFCEVC